MSADARISLYIVAAYILRSLDVAALSVVVICPPTLFIVEQWANMLVCA